MDLPEPRRLRHDRRQRQPDHDYFNLYGATAETIDPLGNVTRFYYDSNLNLTKVIGPGGVTATATYDANGNLTSRPIRSA